MAPRIPKRSEIPVKREYSTLYFKYKTKNQLASSLLLKYILIGLILSKCLGKGSPKIIGARVPLHKVPADF